jgi:hypothetical protein
MYARFGVVRQRRFLSGNSGRMAEWFPERIVDCAVTLYFEQSGIVNYFASGRSSQISSNPDDRLKLGYFFGVSSLQGRRSGMFAAEINRFCGISLDFMDFALCSTSAQTARVMGSLLPALRRTVTDFISASFFVRGWRTRQALASPKPNARLTDALENER